MKVWNNDCLGQADPRGQFLNALAKNLIYPFLYLFTFTVQTKIEKEIDYRNEESMRGEVFHNLAG